MGTKRTIEKSAFKKNSFDRDSWGVVHIVERTASATKTTPIYPYTVISEMPTTSQAVVFTPHRYPLLDQSVGFARSSYTIHIRDDTFSGYILTDLHGQTDPAARTTHWTAARGQRHQHWRTKSERSSIKVGFYLLLSSNHALFRRSRKLPRLAKIIIAAICTAAVATAVAVSLGVILSRTTTTTVTTIAPSTVALFLNTTSTTVSTATTVTTTTATTTTVTTATTGTTTTASTSTSTSTSSATTSTSATTTTTATTTIRKRCSRSHEDMRYLIASEYSLIHPLQSWLSLFCIASLSRDAFWSFDNDVLDLYNNFNANTSGNPSYVTSYLGAGAALSLTRSSSQYAAVIGSQLLFNSSSFTIEAWIYPISLSTVDYGIFGQCQAATTNLCMFFIVRNTRLCCGFWNNDLSGVTALTMNTWSHVACVYNLATQTQQVWLNGILDASRASTPYVGSSAHTTIGVGYLTPPGVNFFNGYIDQMQFSLRAKNTTDMLNDATLVVYYSFDGGSLLDSGPNGINATATGNITSVTGRVNQALQFQGSAYIRPSYTAFFMMGVSNQAFSMALWVQPTGSLTQATLVFVHHPSGWCVGVLSIQSSGSVAANFWSGSTMTAAGPILALNIWTHVGYTYSASNGIRLYINGTLVSASGGFSSSAAGAPVFIALGSNYGNSGCSPFYGGWFTGLLDEYYLYSREITAAQMFILANS